MKNISFLLLAGCLLVIACNNNKPKETTIVSKDGKEKVTIDPNGMENMAVEMEKKKEELTKLTPLTNDELKALLPETLMGAARTDFMASNAMGTGLATARYTINDSTDVELDIYDCAGSAGAGIYSLQYLAMWNVHEEKENEYTKTIDFNGGKAFEHCQKNRNSCTLTYFAGGRYLVTVDGHNVGIDGLKQAAGELGLK